MGGTLTITATVTGVDDVKVDEEVDVSVVDVVGVVVVVGDDVAVVVGVVVRVLPKHRSVNIGSNE